MNPSADDIAMVVDSGLFDLDWYLRRHPGVSTIEDAIAHYLSAGASADLDPGPEFSSNHYLSVNPDVAAADMNPLLHYLQFGRVEGRRRYRIDAPPPHAVPAPFEKERAMIADTALFDADYYLATYDDVRSVGMEPLQHYLEYGAGEGRLPNPYFDTRYYQSVHMSPGDDTNPLVHYLASPLRSDFDTSARFDGHYYRARYVDAAASPLAPLDHFLRYGLMLGRRTMLPSPGALGEASVTDLRRVHCTVIVPVHNAVEAVAECLDALLEHTHFGEQDSLLVIDDASTDPGIAQLLQRLEGCLGIRVERHAQNLGYTRTVNCGLVLASRDDVVLLNSDTVVGPHWLRRLKATATAHERIGTVTAVSNAAGEFSVPAPGNRPPSGMIDGDALARAVEDTAAQPFEVPTGNGFCLYMRRAMLDAVGGFDEIAFPEGYGEENDLCMRAAAAGWTHWVEPTVYVRHRRSASFSERRDALAGVGFRRVCERHPHYEAAIRAISVSPGFIEARYRIGRQFQRLASGGYHPKPRILYVISTRIGGTPQTNADLMRAVAGRFDAYALASDGHRLELLRAGENGYELIERITLSEPLRFASHVSLEYDQAVCALLLRLGIDLMHVRHLVWHGLGLVETARSLGIPVVMSFHDYYCVCPSVHLLDNDAVFHASGVPGHAPNPLWHHDPTLLPMTPAGLAHWQRRMQQVLAGVSAFVTTSPTARRLICEALPGVAARADNFHIIPHGRDFERFLPGPEPVQARLGRPLRVLLPGNLSVHKGIELVHGLKALDVEGRIELHVLGNSPSALEDLVIEHGAYDRGEFADRVEAIAPDLAAVLSIWPETYCHTLTECWAAGLPVVGIDIGAVGERIREQGGGWLLEFPTDPVALYGLLIRLSDEPGDRAERIAEVGRWQAGPGRNGSTVAMAAQYQAIYRNCLEAIAHAQPAGSILQQAQTCSYNQGHQRYGDTS
ncbi:hypothetical protein CSC70_12540 [Pseudoxanthomonas kalamensis DSM 18571]|uniref:glycosyltransferase n=1 Tax=Pseudoxanthomonas kalamensis TaxID=289483 RepID=UPI001390882A|nr:glycosyltransferase [Pseudoxanthomonas kalamensis]KAF1708916.1 hypothetical protein CSC70_12540 [Pseudoxanthomonas kalamensis DSM 18571]